MRKFNTTLKEKNYDHTTFIQYKKTFINFFPLYWIEIKEKSKNLRPNILGNGCTASTQGYWALLLDRPKKVPIVLGPATQQDPMTRC